MFVLWIWVKTIKLNYKRIIKNQQVVKICKRLGKRLTKLNKVLKFHYDKNYINLHRWNARIIFWWRLSDFHFSPNSWRSFTLFNMPNSPQQLAIAKMFFLYLPRWSFLRYNYLCNWLYCLCYLHYMLINSFIEIYNSISFLKLLTFSYS